MNPRESTHLKAAQGMRGQLVLLSFVGIFNLASSLTLNAKPSSDDAESELLKRTEDQFPANTFATAMILTTIFCL